VTTSPKPLTLVKDPERLETRLKEIPPEPGVYFMRDANDNILYIGKSKKLRSRVRSALTFATIMTTIRALP
jgi:excinuclease ABC subunit C